MSKLTNKITGIIPKSFTILDFMETLINFAKFFDNENKKKLIATGFAYDLNTVLQPVTVFEKGKG